MPCVSGPYGHGTLVVPGGPCEAHIARFASADVDGKLYWPPSDGPNQCRDYFLGTLLQFLFISDQFAQNSRIPWVEFLGVASRAEGILIALATTGPFS